MSDIWKLFPFPTLSDGKFTDGALLPVHPQCAECPTLACAQADPIREEIRRCRYGISFAFIDAARLVNGVVVSDDLSLSSRARRHARNDPNRRMKASQLLRAIQQASSLGAGITTDFNAVKEELLDRLERSPEMHAVISEQLRKGFEENLQQSHDFLQLVQLIRGYAEDLLLEKRPGMSLPDAADALPAEGAIYYSTQLMELKIDSLKFMNEINRAVGHETRFQIHPLVVKYARIYKWQADQKSLRFHVEGSCYASCIYNNEAIGTVIQGVLDNLIKYSPSGSEAWIHFEESVDGVELTFSSLGPRIESSEYQKIFLPGFRANAARRIEMTGQGIGLASAKQISDVLDLGLRVEQAAQEDKKYRDRFRTEFSLSLKKAK
jgi:signal transduction histidine kinase